MVVTRPLAPPSWAVVSRRGERRWAQSLLGGRAVLQPHDQGLGLPDGRLEAERLDLEMDKVAQLEVSNSRGMLAPRSK